MTNAYARRKYEIHIKNEDSTSKLHTLVLGLCTPRKHSHTKPKFQILRIYSE